MNDLVSRSALLEKAEGGTVCWFDIKHAPAVDAVVDRFKEAFGSIASYNGHEEWLWELSDELAASDCVKCPITNAEWLTVKHALWMMLVSAFGNWGTSIRYGWIDRTEEAAQFINDATERYAEWRTEDEG